MDRNNLLDLRQTAI